ncbi:MAG: fibronectin type III domain-containing protein [Desulfobacterales bacterium]|nr:fibronectin type III domain-containing protein [Desulfobacterales bacterium]
MTIVDLEPGRTYYFVVTVDDAKGESDESNEKSYLARGIRRAASF